jgi:glucose/arabinose dehydrogenase
MNTAALGPSIALLGSSSGEEGRMRKLRVLLAASAVGVGMAVCGAEVSGADAGDGVVMSGLRNPRGLTFADTEHRHGRRGGGAALYVAEAGTGGTDRCVTLRGAQVCSGSTGAVSRYRSGRQTRIVDGLPSYAPFGAPAAGAIGPQDVSFRNGHGSVAIGLATPVNIRAALGERFGWIARFGQDGHVSYEADVAGFEATANPDAGPVESNPFGLLKGAGGRLVVDAAGNSLLRVSRGGRIEPQAVFESRPQGRATDSVPTSVAVGPDGAYYVGELTGANPFLPGQARIWRIAPGRGPELYCSGFSFIIDLDFDQRGNLYVLEHASGPNGPFAGTPGQLVRVERGCSATPVRTGLQAPMSVAIGPDGDAYVSLNGTTPTNGEVRRLELGTHHHGNHGGDL